MSIENKQKIRRLLFLGKLESVADTVSKHLEENDFNDENLISFLNAYNDYKIKSSLGNFTLEQEISLAVEITESILAKININENSEFEAKNISESELKHFQSLIANNRISDFLEIVFDKINDYPILIQNRIITLGLELNLVRSMSMRGLIDFDEERKYLNGLLNSVLRLIQLLREIEDLQRYHLNALVFVVISFKEEMDEVYNKIKSIASRFGYNAIRVKDVSGDYRITDKIMSLIDRSHFVIADLSYERPNVYFEVGYARGIGKKVISICNKDSEIHFDVKDWTCLYYNNLNDLGQNLDQMLNKFKGGEMEFDSF